jgi:hypothetical protein
MFQTVPVCMNGVADQSLVRLPATTCSWLQRIIPVLQNAARAATPPYILTGWPLRTCPAGSINIKRCTVYSPLFPQPGPVTQQRNVCGYNYRAYCEPPFILHKNDKCVYTHFIDGLYNGKAPTAAAKCRRRFPRRRYPSKRTPVAVRRYLTRKRHVPLGICIGKSQPR